jgi:MFS transporter, DHA3 family, macrolide efflux protein
MRAFFIVWLGQMVSVTGTGLTAFGLAVWVYLETGSVTSLALVTLAAALPATIISPFAGALVDRWDRRTVMLLADLGAGIGTVGIAALYFTGMLEMWHIYLLIGIGSVANSFQSPAWMASVPLLVPKEHLGRANGLIQLNEGLSMVAAPVIAGTLVATLGIGAVLIVDFATFLVGVATLAMVRFPKPEAEPDTQPGTVIKDAIAGWRYIADRGGLLGMLWIFAAVNFALAFGNVLVVPLVLTFASPAAAGSVLSMAGVGLIVGSVLVSAWGGPKRRVRGLMASIGVAGLGVAAVGLRPSLFLVGASFVLVMAVVPIANTSSQVIWQMKVPPAVQGRVFAIRRMISGAISPIAILLAGPLADGVFEPAMAEGGSLAGAFGPIIGTGTGRGIALMFLITGLLTTAVAILGYLLPKIRNVETDLPDHLPTPPVTAAEAPATP